MSQELDLFNLKYQRLMEALRSRMAEVGEQNAGDPEIQVGGQISFRLKEMLILKPVPLHTDAHSCCPKWKHFDTVSPS